LNSARAKKKIKAKREEGSGEIKQTGQKPPRKSRVGAKKRRRYAHAEERKKRVTRSSQERNERGTIFNLGETMKHWGTIPAARLKYQAKKTSSQGGER